MRNRQGKFYISHVVIDLHPEAVMNIMSKVIVVRCEYQYHSMMFEYIALSNEFDEVEEGCSVPQYDVSYNDKNEVGFNKV